MRVPLNARVSAQLVGKKYFERDRSKRNTTYFTFCRHRMPDTPPVAPPSMSIRRLHGMCNVCFVSFLERGLGPAPRLGQSIANESSISNGSFSLCLTGPIKLHINCSRGHKSMPLTVDDASGCFDQDSSKSFETSVWFVCWITCLFVLFPTCGNTDSSVIWHALTSPATRRPHCDV